MILRNDHQGQKRVVNGGDGTEKFSYLHIEIFPIKLIKAVRGNTFQSTLVYGSS